jgi:hypothetical protein
MAGMPGLGGAAAATAAAAAMPASSGAAGSGAGGTSNHGAADHGLGDATFAAVPVSGSARDAGGARVPGVPLPSSLPENQTFSMTLDDVPLGLGDFSIDTDDLQDILRVEGDLHPDDSPWQMMEDFSVAGGTPPP